MKKVTRKTIIESFYFKRYSTASLQPVIYIPGLGFGLGFRRASSKDTQDLRPLT